MYSLNLAQTAQSLSLNKYVIASYLRISQDDGKDLESNSIKNQREIIKNYVAKHDDFKLAPIIDYVDDGISGSHSEREAYKRLLEDIKNGKIDCVIVKDLSRIGRNLIDVDDLLMNHLVTLNVRFIAINNGYDSFSSPLSNLELAIINLANQHYNRDLAIKSITAKHVKAKRGEYLALAPFGYKKSKTEKNKLVPDDEAAGYVKLIYSLAVEGRSTVEIAQILNAQGIPSPSIYKKNKGIQDVWVNVIDPDYCFWTNSVVRNLLRNEVYIGKAIANKYKVTVPSTSRCVPRPKDEWIIVPGAHEPLVSENDFQKAQLVYQKKKYDSKPDNIFGNKLKCPYCGHAMSRYTHKNPRYKCGTAKLTDYYGCKNYNVLQSDVERIVLETIKVYASVSLDREKLRLAKMQQNQLSAKELERKIATESKTVEILESSVTKIYKDFSDGKITKEDFQYKKESINDTATRKRMEIEKWDEQCNRIKDGLSSAETAVAELMPLLTIETLNKDIVNLLIDKILVHSEKDIEIVWNCRFYQ